VHELARHPCFAERRKCKVLQGGARCHRFESTIRLERYRWPGNERRLDNAIEHASVMGEGPVLEATDLPPQLTESHAPPADAATTEDRSAINRPALIVPENLSAEERRMWNALERSDGHRARAAASLGVSRVTLWRKMRKHGLAS
jgi:transcriptional regulator of acetoin/glycerol metabolism